MAEFTPKFNIGDRVRLNTTEERQVEDLPWEGEGTVTAQPECDGDFYYVDLRGVDDPYWEDELELVATVATPAEALPYAIVHSSWDHEETERMLAATMTLTAEDYRRLNNGAPVIKRVPDCLSFKYVVEVDSEGSVMFSRKGESRNG